MKRLAAAAALCVFPFFPAFPAVAETIEWEPYPYTTRDGVEIGDAERGRLRVPEDRSSENGPTIELSFIRFRSTAETPGPPIVWLAGGPGDFGSDDIEGPYLDLVRAFQAVADVVALDQRGTGLSRPRLTCPDDVVELPLDQPLHRDRLIDAYREVSRSCAEHWAEKGVDLSAYNTVENADDVEGLRRALGAPKISLYGGSYGTHLALAVIRRHPERVHRAVLSGVEGPDHTWKLPSAVESHFVEIARTQARRRKEPDAGPRMSDPLAMMRAVVARLDKKPVTVDVDNGEGESVAITLGGLDARLANRYFLGDRNLIEQLPAIYGALADGDYSLLGQVSLRARRVQVSSAMYYAMDCSSGMSVARAERIRRETELAHGLVGAALNLPFPDVCEVWPHRDLGDSFRGPLVSDVPVLFVSGTLDGQTPVSNVSELLPGFSRGSHLVVVDASHQYLEFSHPEIPRVMVDHLKGGEPGASVLQASAL